MGSPVQVVSSQLAVAVTGVDRPPAGLPGAPVQSDQVMGHFFAVRSR